MRPGFPSWGAQNPDRQHQEVAALRERLWLGIRLFQAGQDGQRERAVQHFLHVLAHPLRVPGFRLAAACLIAETFRGVERYSDAEQYYRLALEESESIPEDEQLQSDWWRHYRPRSQLGLFMAYRQLLSKEPAHMRAILADAMRRFSHVDNVDFSALLTALDGLLSRQCGDLDGAQDLLSQAVEAMAELSPPFLLLCPDHVEGLLAQSLLLLPSGQVQAGRIARGLLGRANLTSWTAALARGVVLHGALAQTFAAPSVAQVARRLLDGNGPLCVDELLSEMESAAASERDPALMTENLGLRAAFLLAAQREEAEATLQALLRLTRAQNPVIRLLRSLEIAAAWLLAVGNRPTLGALADLCTLGLEALTALMPGLTAFGLEEAEITTCRGWLRGPLGDSASIPCGWLDGTLGHLRARLWP